MKTRKPLLALSFVVVARLGLAQQPTAEPLQFQEVVTVEGATRDQLYAAALAWFPAVFKSGKEVLQVQNREAGMLVGTAFEPFTYNRHILISVFPLRARIRYHVTVEVKDGRYRFTADGFMHEPLPSEILSPSFGQLTTDARPPAPRGQGLPEGDRLKAWNEMKQRATTATADLAKTLKAKLSTAATEKSW